ncbi:MAG: electron transport complex subunit E [Verrucomicrobiota bacterium]|nr:electron transport complex subunit E [Verrucomicrobiota bacterium]
MGLKKEFTKGLWDENPVLILLLGMCPTLAVTSNMKNGLGMGVATTFVLLGSNIVISLLRKVIPKKIRIPCFIVIIATFVTLVEMLMKAYAPSELNQALGIFIPLIVVNCIVLGRAEAFASKNTLMKSIADGLGMGVGFIFALMALGGVREFLAAGTLFEIKIITSWNTEFLLMKFAPGAFIVLGLFLAGMNKLKMIQAEKEGRIYTPPPELNCSHCRLCDLSSIDTEE